MFRENALDQAASQWRQMNHDHAPVVFLPFAAHQRLSFKVVDDQGDIAAAPEQFFAQGPLAHWPQIEQGLQHPELPHRQSVLFDTGVQPRDQGVGCADQVDVRVERPNRLLAASVMSGHIRSAVNRLMSNYKMHPAGGGFRPAGKTGQSSGFLRGANEYLADEALGGLCDDHLHRMRYVLGLQHFCRIFALVR